jgi:hypothetical protein
MSMSPAISSSCTGGQLEQAQQVGGGRAGAPDGVGGLLVGHAELVDEALDAGGLFEGLRSSRWMFSIRDMASAASSGISRTRQGTSQAGDLGGTPAAFAGDDLVAFGVKHGADGAHQDRLHHALGLDRGGQLFERARVHAGAWLVLARLQLGGGQGLQFAFSPVAVVVGGEEGVEPPAEAFEFGRCHGGIQRVLTRSIISLAKAR